jgi:hypothetical protein
MHDSLLGKLQVYLRKTKIFRVNTNSSYASCQCSRDDRFGGLYKNETAPVIWGGAITAYGSMGWSQGENRIRVMFFRSSHEHRELVGIDPEKELIAIAHCELYLNELRQTPPCIEIKGAEHEVNILRSCEEGRSPMGRVENRIGPIDSG